MKRIRQILMFLTSSDDLEMGFIETMQNKSTGRKMVGGLRVAFSMKFTLQILEVQFWYIADWLS